MAPNDPRVPGRIPAIAFVSLGLGVVGAVVFPLVYAAIAFFSMREDIMDRLGPAMVAGGIVVVAALVTSVIGIVQSRAAQASLAPSIVGLVFSLLAPVTGAASGFFALLLAGGGPGGRPFRVDGRARTAPPARDAAWVDAALAPAVDHLPADARERLAAHWLAAALTEHASVAAFARLALDLLAVGAPPALLTATTAAAAEEIEHARVCFAVAAALGGRPVGPGDFPLATHARARTVDLATIARDAHVDGCLGEGVAAALARRAAARCTDATVRAALERIADDEARHAELSRAIVRWCYARGVAPIAEPDASAVALPPNESDDATLLAWGWPAAGDGAWALRQARGRDS